MGAPDTTTAPISVIPAGGDLGDRQEHPAGLFRSWPTSAALDCAPCSPDKAAAAGGQTDPAPCFDEIMEVFDMTGFSDILTPLNRLTARMLSRFTGGCCIYGQPFRYPSIERLRFGI